MSELPDVSVCLLTYKRASILGRSLESVLRQSHERFELIVNDDRSPDDTEAVVRSFEARDSRVRYVRNEKNLRYAGNQNAALARARHDLVAILHDGDVYREDLLAKWTAAMVKHPSAALVFNALEIMGPDGTTEWISRHEFPELVPGRWLLKRMLQTPFSPIFGIVMVRKTMVEATGLFDTALPVLGDVDMWMRLLSRHDAVYLDEPLLKIAGREANHVNRAGNWAIRSEHERIYWLNLERNRSDPEIGDGAFRRRVARMLVKMRVRWLMRCIRDGSVKRTVEGLRFLVRPVLEGGT